MKADLHMHSTYSDGRYTMRELVEEAAQKNLDVIAITDHDVVGDIEDAIHYGKRLGIRVLPGIELSTLEQHKSVHVLGYFTDDSYHNQEMTSYYVDIKRRREERAKQMIVKLEHYYNIVITYESVQQEAGGIIARPHIAKAITKAYPKYDHDYIFDHFIGDHCEAYIPSVELPVEEGLELLKRNNCITVLAHPTLLKPHIKDKVLSYDYDGIEAIYYRNKPGEEETFTTLAKTRRMLITAGSDFHGIKGDTKHGRLGEIVLQGDTLETFLKRLEKKQI
jgi:predicted metal-dependent phosphoesterase TrpH